ncbi:MAG: hypothetical protein LBQ21_06650 [Clostridiales Family XIII bacterium]|jgi:hypothetical protein|nr:hypothetical protein [Clostridiales Family XIII bacterium]
MSTEKERTIQGLETLIYCGEHEIIPTKYVKTDHYKRAFEYVDCRQYAAWRDRVVTFLERFLDARSPYLKSLECLAIYHFCNVNTIIELLSDIKLGIADGSIAVCEDACPDNVILLRSLLERFHLAVSRPHLYRGDAEDGVCDEQKLLHTLLQLCFDDIRTVTRPPLHDDGIPAYFLLTADRFTVEMKILREESPGDGFKEALTTGVDYHRNRSECDRLFFLVYDPGATITDPHGIENEFRLRHNGFAEMIISAPFISHE